MPWKLVLGLKWVQVARRGDSLLDGVWVASWNVVEGLGHLLEVLATLPREHALVFGVRLSPKDVACTQSFLVTDFLGEVSGLGAVDGTVGAVDLSVGCARKVSAHGVSQRIERVETIGNSG